VAYQLNHFAVFVLGVGLWPLLPFYWLGWMSVLEGLGAPTVGALVGAAWSLLYGLHDAEPSFGVPAPQRGTDVASELFVAVLMGLVLGLPQPMFQRTLKALLDLTRTIPGLLPWGVWVLVIGLVIIIVVMRTAGNTRREPNTGHRPGPSSALSPAQTYGPEHQWRRGALEYAIFCAVFFGAFTAVAGLPTPGLAVRWLTMLVSIPLVFGVLTARSHFLVMASVETLRGRLPAPHRVMPLLEDCYRLGLLRTIGPVYQFRHAELQNHFSAHVPSSDPNGAPSPNPAPEATAPTGDNAGTGPTP
jgi:hypothetical protein